MKADLFDEVYRANFDPVYRYVLSLSGNAHVAEEITQETFFKALKSLGEFRGDCSLKSWLCTIARNLWLTERRRKKPLAIDDAASFADSAAGPEETALRRDESMRAHLLVHHLNEPYREVFMLRALGQLSFRDIGEIFGKSDNWACVVYHRARARIKNGMEEEK